MIDEKFIIITVILNFIGAGSYAWDTIKGRTQPNRVTWFLWALISLIVLGAMIDEKAGVTALIMTFSLFIGPFTIFLLSFVNKKSVWKITKFDWGCGGLSVCAILAWVITGEGSLAIIFSILADLFAFLPTLLKSIKAPDTESWLLYFNAVISSAITLFTLKAWTFASVSYPLWILLISLVAFLLIKFRLGPRFMINPAK